jgi:hypothetical protein
MNRVLISNHKASSILRSSGNQKRKTSRSISFHLLTCIPSPRLSPTTSEQSSTMATPTPFALKLDPAAAAALAAQKAAEFHQDLNVRLTCPDCKDDTDLLEEYSSGDLVCGNCGKSRGY